eukprot:1161444-Pelagomonas_calceolata.AAC.3
MGILRVQKAPSTPGVREGVFNILEGLGMELAITISGGQYGSSGGRNYDLHSRVAQGDVCKVAKAGEARRLAKLGSLHVAR